ncbi:MAG: hypothetical protein HQ508_07265, partial [Candidatus Marinimicrobia bacterium]|nr:hypothetical protein [Candidatus Neomarinimicrobiota bacterium]
MLSNARPYLLRGLVEEDYGAISLTVKHIEFLDKVRIPRQIGPAKPRMLPQATRNVRKALPPPNSPSH